MNYFSTKQETGKNTAGVFQVGRRLEEHACQGTFNAYTQQKVYAVLFVPKSLELFYDYQIGYFVFAHQM